MDHLGSALAAICPTGGDKPVALLVHRIAYVLGKGLGAQTINTHLGNIRPPRGKTADVIALHRAAMLIELVLLPSTPLRGVVRPTNFREIDLDMYIDTVRRRTADFVPASNPATPYLAGSFLLYASSAECNQVLQAIPEAVTLLRAGERAVASMSPADAPANASRALFTRWFGAQPPTGAADVTRRLQQTIAGLASGVCFNYAGAGVGTNRHGIGEMGFNTSDTNKAGAVRSGEDWGSAKATVGPYILLEKKFFLGSETSGLPLARHHDTDSAAMEVSRGGAILHEATHVFAATHDERLPLPSNAQAYGSNLARRLAIAAPAKSLRNADTYRLFCEDAYVMQQEPVPVPVLAPGLPAPVVP